ncbi:tripartite tricarboxylate transporter TctB family protein [Leisingera sp. S132]|uniref:tripartite tricarboxylate transporter TctB family protein n=1 Tax=Leisingera sp. S132 TaxID=2867016 RepID=UPI0021A8E3B7|nr:tripartite tricarboxylate transporter TctB family protein [Leisingera sp. S132]UWQ79882.1 tripartite tricarboxylate transporter TctB family protein [Leisingera sp. S132]
MTRIKYFQELFQRYRRPGDLVFAVMFLLFALFLLSQLGEQTKWVKRTKWFGQPSLWPSVAVWGMVVFGAFHLLGSMVSPRISGRLKEVVFWLRSLEYVLYFLAYVAIVPLFGYLPSTILFALFLTLRAGFRRPLHLALATLFATCVALIFRGFLQVKIPAGEIYQHLPEALRAFAMTYL